MFHDEEDDLISLAIHGVDPENLRGPGQAVCCVACPQARLVAL